MATISTMIAGILISETKAPRRNATPPTISKTIVAHPNCCAAGIPNECKTVTKTAGPLDHFANPCIRNPYPIISRRGKPANLANRQRELVSISSSERIICSFLIRLHRFEDGESASPAKVGACCGRRYTAARVAKSQSCNSVKPCRFRKALDLSYLPKCAVGLNSENSYRSDFTVQ